MFQKNSSLTDQQIREKAEGLLKKMSLKDKVMFLSGNWQMIRDSILYKRTYNPVPIKSHGSRRLKINPIAFTDGPRGVVMGNSTCFPVSMARAANTGDHGSSNVYPPSVVTALQGIREKLGAAAKVIHVGETELDRIKKLAPKATAVIIVAGNDYNDEGEYVMPDADIDFQALMAQGLLNNGNKLLGTVMSRAKQERNASYTSDDGKIAGTEIVQVYVSVPKSNVERHVRELKGFVRVALQVGETKTAEIHIPIEELKYYNEETGSWILEQTEYEFQTGSCADPNSLQTVNCQL